MIESNVWLERAGLFELLAKSFSFPAFDLAAALASGEYSQASREMCHAWGITDVRLDALLERVDDKYAGDEDTALQSNTPGCSSAPENLWFRLTEAIGRRLPRGGTPFCFSVEKRRKWKARCTRRASEIGRGCASHSTILRASLNSSSTCARLKGALKSRAREPQWARVCTRHS